MNKKLNVLSLFDGMSCGHIALDKTDFEIDNYMASEIDPYAIKITQKNYPNTIQLGDIKQINGKDLPNIDLLIGGSPCQGFSRCGLQLNFDDPRSKLFFEYVRLLKETKPKYFLLENVKMKKEYEDVISEFLGVEPIEIDSRLLSAQKRRRLYWTNIPNIEIPKDKNIQLKDILLDRSDSRFILDVPTEARLNYIKRRSSLGWLKKGWCTIETKKAECITAVSHKNLKEYVYEDDNGLRFLTCIELERLQTVPDDYTLGVSKSQRIKMLGNGWTVDVIYHIFKNMNF
jgi:site-specific DNA-cytosine methylase